MLGIKYIYPPRKSCRPLVYSLSGKFKYEFAERLSVPSALRFKYDRNWDVGDRTISFIQDVSIISGC